MNITEAMDNGLILKILLMVLYCLIGRGVSGQEIRGDSLSLSDCIRIAWKNNYESQKSALNRRLSEIDYHESRQNLIPGVNLGVGHNLSQGRRIDLVTNQYINQRFSSGNQFVSSSVTLFRGLESLYRIRQQAAAGKAASLEEQAAKDQVMLDVILAYLQALTSRDILSQTEMRVELTRQQLKRISDLHANGAVLPSDYYDLKGQLAGDLSALNDVKKTHLNAVIALAGVMNIPYEQLVPLRMPDIEFLRLSPDLPAPEKTFETVSLWLPALKAAEWRIVQAKEGIRVARSGHSPRLTLGAGFESTYSSNSNLGYFEQAKNNIGRYLSFGITIPLTDHILVRNNVMRAKINLEDAEYSAQNTRNEWQRTISRTALNLDLARQNLGNLAERELNFRESFRIATVRFEAGDINSVLFLTSKNNMDQAGADKIIGQYEWMLQRLISGYYTGKLYESYEL